jgi:hypothetical protein
VAEKTEKNPRGAGRPPKQDNQVQILVSKVMETNKKLDKGLVKIGESYPDIAQTAIDVALGNGEETIVLRDGTVTLIPRKPDTAMLTTLLKIGIDMIDKTGEGPESLSQQILKNMRNRVQELTQVKIDNLTIIDGNTPNTVEANS